MGPKDVERHEESKAEGQEQRALKMQDRFSTEFEKKKREKLGLKKVEPAESDMLEWIDLQKQLQIDRDTGKSYVTTPWEKTKGVFLDNPLVPLGKNDADKTCNFKYKIYTHVNENPTDFRPWGYNFCANDGSSGFRERKSEPKVLDVVSGRSTRRNNCRVVSQCILCRYQTATEREKCSFYP